MTFRLLAPAHFLWDLGPDPSVLPVCLWYADAVTEHFILGLNSNVHPYIKGFREVLQLSARTRPFVEGWGNFQENGNNLTSPAL
jgi:hypothetical protein